MKIEFRLHGDMQGDKIAANLIELVIFLAKFLVG